VRTRLRQFVIDDGGLESRQMHGYDLIAVTRQEQKWIILFYILPQTVIYEEKTAAKMLE
jgi:hypothetical protein